MTQAVNLTPPTQVVLKVSFDVDQHSSGLAHVLLPVTSTPDPVPREGVHANSMYFAPGEQVLVQITACGAVANGFDSFQVLDCVIVTCPQVVQRGPGLVTRFAAPSPFLQAVGACYPLPLDFYAQVNPLSEDHERIVTQTWKHSLDVDVSPGIWELSMVLTVRITRGPGVADEVRVFSFDPEAEVGSTGTIK